MPMPPLLSLDCEADYRAHFERVYCKGSIMTFDGILVRFRKRDFDHCCFESDRGTRNKAHFFWQRAERLDWIWAALQDPDADLRVGWDRARQQYDRTRRVTIISANYIVVISIIAGQNAARFITAYLADSEATVRKIKRSPKWRGVQA